MLFFLTAIYGSNTRTWMVTMTWMDDLIVLHGFQWVLKYQDDGRVFMQGSMQMKCHFGMGRILPPS